MTIYAGLEASDKTARLCGDQRRRCDPPRRAR